MHIYEHKKKAEEKNNQQSARSRGLRRRDSFPRGVCVMLRSPPIRTTTGFVWPSEGMYMYHSDPEYKPHLTLISYCARCFYFHPDWYDLFLLFSFSFPTMCSQRALLIQNEKADTIRRIPSISSKPLPFPAHTEVIEGGQYLAPAQARRCAYTHTQKFTYDMSRKHRHRYEGLVDIDTNIAHSTSTVNITADADSRSINLS